MSAELDADLSYEKALEMFDDRLRALEEGKLSLEDALAAVQDARRYLLVCEAKLAEAKGRLETRQPGVSAPPREAPEPPSRPRILDTEPRDVEDQPEIPF